MLASWIHFTVPRFTVDEGFFLKLDVRISYANQSAGQQSLIEESKSIQRKWSRQNFAYFKNAKKERKMQGLRWENESAITPKWSGCLSAWQRCSAERGSLQQIKACVDIQGSSDWNAMRITFWLSEEKKRKQLYSGKHSTMGSGLYAV